MIPGLNLIEMDESDWCCGSAGSQLITHYQTSIAVLERKMKNIKASGADMVASGCPGCQMQLQVGIKRHHIKVKVTHPVELLDKAYFSSE